MRKRRIIVGALLMSLLLDISAVAQDSAADPGYQEMQEEVDIIPEAQDEQDGAAEDTAPDQEGQPEAVEEDTEGASAGEEDPVEEDAVEEGAADEPPVVEAPTMQETQEEPPQAEALIEEEDAAAAQADLERAADAPQLVSVKNDRNTGLRLTWKASSKGASASESALKYYIARSTDGKTFTRMWGREAKYGLYYLDASGLKAGTTYYYKVIEEISGKETGESNVISATAKTSAKGDNEFTKREDAVAYLKEQMKARETDITIFYNASSFPSGISNELYEAAVADAEGTSAAAAAEGDYLRYTIKPEDVSGKPKTYPAGIDGKVGSLTSYTLRFTFDYYSTKAEEDAVDAKVAEILAGFKADGITRSSSEYDRAKAVYDYITVNTAYNNGTRPDTGNLMITAYDALVRQEAQCYGQLLGAYRLLKELGLPTRRINGKTNVDLGGGSKWVNHGWNIVKVGGKWYNFDVTGSSAFYQEAKETSYKFLLFNETEMKGSYERAADFASGSSFYSKHPMSTGTFGSEPEAPQAPTLTGVNKTTIKVTYPKVSGAEGYVLYRGASATGKFTEVARSTTTTLVDKTATVGSTYHYKVKAYKTVQGYKYYSRYSPRRIITHKEMGTPDKVTVSQNSYNSLKVTWTAVEGAAYYQLYRSTKAEDGFVLLGTYDNKTFQKISSGLGCGTTYYYKVRAYKWVNGERSFGNFSSTISGAPALPKPTGVTTASASGTTVKVNWNLVNGADYYQVYRATSSNGKYALLGTYDSKTKSSISRSLSTGTKYYYKVRAYRWVGGNRIFSSFSAISTATPTFTKPTGVSAASASATTVRVSWNLLDGAQYYQVYRATSADGKYALLGTYDSTTKSSISRSLVTGKKYYYKVRGYRWVNGERVFSPFSAVTSATPKG